MDTRTLFSEVKLLEHEADHFPLAAEIKIVGSLPQLTPYAFTQWFRGIGINLCLLYSSKGKVVLCLTN
jgi:hypothetical protein